MTITTAIPEKPLLAGQQSEVVPGSPTAILALFSEVIRERFRPSNQLPWVWTEDPTPLPTEDGDLDGPRKILIVPAFSEHAEVRNYRPAIYIDKGDTQMLRAAVGHLAAVHLPSSTETFYAQASMPIDIECVSDSKGESATLADTVWFYILAGRNQIRQTFGFHELTEPVLGQTVPGEKDKVEWSTHVRFSVSIHLHWRTQPIAPLLQGIVVRFRDSGNPNPDAFLLEEYLP